MKTFASMLFLLALTYTLAAGYLYFTQASHVFFPTRVLLGSPADIGLNFEDLRLETRDGEELHGWFIPATDARYTLLFLHGNAGNISHRLDSLRLFHELGFSVMILDYRGYGRSTGEPSEKGSYLDALAAWGYLREQRGLDPSRIVLFGRSLGGAVAAWLAHTHPPAALVLESTFTSLPDLGAELYPWLPVKLLSRIHYHSRHRVREIHSPLLVIHSPDDEIIPFHHGQQLYDAAPGRKSFLQIQGGHNDGFLRSAPAYGQGIRSFVDLLEQPAGTKTPGTAAPL